MARGQKRGWKLSQKVPKERPSKPIRIEPGIWYRSTGHFEVFIYFRGRDIFVGTFETIQDAADARDRRRAELEAGRPIVRVADGRTLLTDFAERIYFPQTAGLRKASTARASRSRYNAHIKPAFTDTRLRDISYESLCDFRSKLETTAHSGQTRQEVLYVLKAILEEAKERGLIPANPAAGLRLPPKKPTQVVVPTYEDAIMVVEAITHPVARMLAETLLYAGTRVNEALALRWDDIDFDEKTIFVSRSIDQVTGELVAPKTASGVRLVELPDALVDRLRAYRERQLAGEVTRADPWVFPAKTDRTDGRPPVLHDRNFAQRYWATAIAEVGTKRFTPHALRHVYCSILLMRGAAPTYVSAQAGHANPGFTLRQYSRFLRSKKESGRGYLQKAFGPSAPATPSPQAS